MKKFRNIWITVIGIVLLLFIIVNLWLYGWEKQENGRLYKVELSRVYRQLEEGVKHMELEGLLYVKEITVLQEEDMAKGRTAYFPPGNLDYAVWQINGIYYRIGYEANTSGTVSQTAAIVNGLLLIMALVLIGMIWYFWKYLWKPFQKISEMPYELSKGNLTTGLEEQKNRFFGRFIWGLDLLRENLEAERKKELELQKEKKTLVLSVSHDIKTPLSAIKLYAKALERNLYDTEEKRMEIAENINQKTEEIERFVTEIIQASNEDFLNLEVRQDEFYLKTLIEEIQGYYQGKLELLRIGFTCGNYQDCLLKGDLDRAAEVLQNMIENAIKYGDGGSISLGFSEEEDCWLVTVRNSGCTLSQEELPYIFQSFWRGSNVGNNAGSGLGLYICRQLMRKMDGDIYARQEEGEIQVTAVFRRV